MQLAMRFPIRSLAAGSLVAAALWILRCWVLHALDIIVAHARGLPNKRKKNAFLKGDTATLPIPAVCAARATLFHLSIWSESFSCSNAYGGPFQAGMFAPVDSEVTSTDLETEGEMPTALYGCANPSCIQSCPVFTPFYPTS